MVAFVSRRRSGAHVCATGAIAAGTAYFRATSRLFGARSRHRGAAAGQPGDYFVVGPHCFCATSKILGLPHPTSPKCISARPRRTFCAAGAHFCATDCDCGHGRRRCAPSKCTSARPCPRPRWEDGGGGVMNLSHMHARHHDTASPPQRIAQLCHSSHHAVALVPSICYARS